MIGPFQWGRGGQVLTPDQVARRREIAEAAQSRAGDTSPVAHWTQGAARVVDALSGVVNARRADQGEAAGMAAAEEYVQGNPVLSGLMGGGKSFSLPQTADAAALRQGLVSRGLPEHVADAFVLNFKDESGLDPGINEREPLVPGSRGGFGLYQLTGPRRVAYEQFAAQRGVDPSDVDAQLDFLMAELQGPEARAAQSILSAPDTGTAAAAIVNEFLRPAEEHRAARAARYTGGGGMDASGQPVPVTGGGGDVVGALAGAMSNPWVAQRYGPVIEALMNQQMRRGDMQFQQQLAQSDPMRQMQMERARLELEAMRNPVAQPIEVGGVLLDPNTFEPIFDSREPDAAAMPLRTPEERAAWGIPPDDMRPYAVKPGGIPQVVGGASTEINLDMNGAPRPELLGTQGLVAIPDDTVPQGFRVEPAPGSPLALEREQAAQSGERRDGTRTTESDIVATAASRAREAYQSRTVGGALGRVAAVNPASDNAELYRQVDVLRAQAQLGNLTAMREASPTGGALGSVTEGELKILADKSGALDPASPNFLRDLDDYERTLLRTIHGPEAGDAIFEQSRGGGPQTFETFAADPSAQAAAERYGVTLEEMWAIQQGLD